MRLYFLYALQHIMYHRNEKKPIYFSYINSNILLKIYFFAWFFSLSWAYLLLFLCESGIQDRRFTHNRSFLHCIFSLKRYVFRMMQYVCLFVLSFTSHSRIFHSYGVDAVCITSHWLYSNNKVTIFFLSKKSIFSYRWHFRQWGSKQSWKAPSRKLRSGWICLWYPRRRPNWK